MDSKIQKAQKAQLPLLKSWEQKQGVRRNSRVLHMPPAHNTTKVTPLVQPLTAPCPHPNKEPTCPHSGRTKETYCLFAPHCCSRGHSKALPGFLVWALISYYRLRIPWALMGYALKLCQTFVIFLRARGFATETCYPGHWWNGLALWNVTLAAVWWRESERRRDF